MLGRDAVVGGDVLVVGVAGDEVFGGNEAAGVDAMHLVEGVDGKGGELEAGRVVAQGVATRAGLRFGGAGLDLDEGIWLVRGGLSRC